MKDNSFSLALVAFLLLIPALSSAKVTIEVEPKAAPAARPYADLRGFNFDVG